MKCVAELQGRGKETAQLDISAGTRQRPLWERCFRCHTELPSANGGSQNERNAIISVEEKDCGGRKQAQTTTG